MESAVSMSTNKTLYVRDDDSGTWEEAERYAETTRQSVSMVVVDALRQYLPLAQPDVGPGRRQYGMMQHLMSVAAHHEMPEVPPERGIVNLEDALNAVLQLAAVIDWATQEGHIPPDKGVHAASMLMVVRDYIQPLPPGLAADGVTDEATADLDEMVKAIRQVAGDTGMQG
jgi:hypothetical protein